MKRHQVITDNDELKVRVVASTRAGFMSAALEGLFAAAQARFVETDVDTRFVAPESERQFKVTADSFPELLAAFLEEAWQQAKQQKEAFIGLRLSLITDKQAEGAFLGQPVTGFGRELTGVETVGLTVEKNELGYWESTIGLRS